MVKELLARARLEAERASPPVRVAAKLRIARLESATDRSAARVTLEMAIQEISSLPKADREAFLDQARNTAAAVAPTLLRELPHGKVHGHLQRFSTGTLVSIMLSHGHTEEALAFLLSHDEPSSFPFGYVGNVLQRTSNPEQRLRLVRSAIASWRIAPAQEFLWVFKIHWSALPEEEARTVLREIVQQELDQPDSPTNAGYDDGKLRFTSRRAHTLFEVLHVLRRLEPGLAEEFIASQPELAMGVSRYPNGWETIWQEIEDARRRRVEAGETCGGGFVMSGDPRDRAYVMALHRASQDGNFAPALDEALHQYADDASPEHPNQAPKEFWPSTVRFRNILFAAGKRIGEAAGVHLAAITDKDLRLLAGIELAAALAGLPEMPSMQRQYRPGWQRTPGAPDQPSAWQRRWPLERYASAGATIFGVRVRCPKCNWLPAEQDRWSCRCQHRWNTFATHGRCPQCEYQWHVTACMSCSQSSPHEDWYLPA